MNARPIKRFFCAVVIFTFVLLARAANAEDLMVFAAASLTDSLKQIATNYQANTGQKVVFNFGASSMLTRQIEEGAPADIFFSADEAKMDLLEKKGLILTGTRKSRLGNSLVIVIEKNSTLKINSATNLADANITRIALADPKAVPAGIYSKLYLEKLHLWSQIESKVVPTDNVRAALAAVESGNVETGMVYKTDAAISKKVKVAYEIMPQDGPDISYPLAVVKTSNNKIAAKKFVEYLDGMESFLVFESYGFIVRK